MFRIGEFSRLTQVTVRMLRYYDETGLLRPAMVDPRTGYRLYETRQIPRLNQIIYLRGQRFQRGGDRRRPGGGGRRPAGGAAGPEGLDQPLLAVCRYLVDLLDDTAGWIRRIWRT